MSEPLLAVEGLSGYYGTAHVLQDVAFTMGAEPVAMIGRNGMGKSTLCKAMTGLLGATGHSDGSVRLDGVELHGKPAYRIAKAGVGYVPQGRRLFTSLSGDEQQMLAISRALLTNPRLLIMDEPSEGLAPTIVEGLIQTIKDLAAEGMGLLVVEQNLGVATTLADRQLVMIAGNIAAETTAEALTNDPAAQRRYLGVEPLAASA